MSLWVIDSSPLIFLAKLNRLDLLRKEAEEILVPPAVLVEIAGQDDEAAFRSKRLGGRGCRCGR